MNGDQTLESLKRESDRIRSLEVQLEEARKVRDRLILGAATARLGSYRSLAKRSHLTPSRIAQVVEQQRKLARLSGRKPR